MSDYYGDDEQGHPARISTHTQIVVPPPGTQAWLVFLDSSDGTHFPDGPYVVAAISTAFNELSATSNRVKIAGRGTAYYFDAPDAFLDFDGVENSVIRVLLLFPEFGDVADPWIERKYVFFSYDSAKTAADARTADERERQRRVAEMSAKP